MIYIYTHIYIVIYIYLKLLCEYSQIGKLLFSEHVQVLVKNLFG